MSEPILGDPRAQRLWEWVVSDPRSQDVPEDERWVYFELGVRLAIEKALEHGTDV